MYDLGSKLFHFVPHELSFSLSLSLLIFARPLNLKQIYKQLEFFSILSLYHCNRQKKEKKLQFQHIFNIISYHLTIFNIHSYVLRVIKLVNSNFLLLILQVYIISLLIILLGNIVFRSFINPITIKYIYFFYLYLQNSIELFAGFLRILIFNLSLLSMFQIRLSTLFFVFVFIYCCPILYYII